MRRNFDQVVDLFQEMFGHLIQGFMASISTSVEIWSTQIMGLLLSDDGLEIFR